MTERDASLPSSSITLRQEWTVILVCAGLVASAEIAAVLLNHEWVTILSVLSALTSWFGHAVWLSMDRRRRGLEIGAWRFAVIMIGPFAIAFYLLLEYRARALYLIPLQLAVYGVTGI